MTDFNGKSCCLGALILSGLTSPIAGAQHVHGAIDLGIVVEDAAIAISFESPLANVVGFEYEPQTKEEIEGVRTAAIRMNSAADMFLLPASAACESVEVKVTGPDYLTTVAADTQPLSQSSNHASNHHDDDHDDDDYSDSHDDHDSHDDDDHGDSHDDHDDKHDSEVHNDVEAQYHWHCDNPSELEEITLSFTSWFADVDTVTVQLITADGVQVLELDKSSTTINLTQ